MTDTPEQREADRLRRRAADLLDIAARREATRPLDNAAEASAAGGIRRYADSLRQRADTKEQVHSRGDGFDADDQAAVDSPAEAAA